MAASTIDPDDIPVAAFTPLVPGNRVKPRIFDHRMNIFLALPTDPQTWTVGFFGPDGQWQPESDHGSDEAAARRRAAWLNGAVEQRQRLLASVPSVPVNTEMRTWLVK